MPDITFAHDRPRADLIAAVCRRTGSIDRSLRVIAEGILGAGSPIDIVAVDGDGCLVLVLACHEGQDLELFTRAIAQRAWVTPRVRDWVQLAPSIGLQPDAPVRLSLLSPSYRPETLAAAAAMGPGIFSLSTYRWVENGSAASVLIEAVTPPEGTSIEVPAGGAAPASFVPGLTPTPGRAPDPTAAAPSPDAMPDAMPAATPAPGPGPGPGPMPTSSAREPAEAARGSDGVRAASGTRFRTGLTAEDLNLTPQEAREFE